MQPISEKMTNKIILVAGGANDVGMGIVRYFLQQDATLIVPATSLTEINRLKSRLADVSTGTLITQLTELPDYDSGFDIAETIVERFGKIDIGIAVFNSSPCNSELTEMHISDWQDMMDNDVTPFFVCARLMLRTMKENKDGLYISIANSRLLKENALFPLSKIAANFKMELSKIFARETKSHNVRYYHLWVDQHNEPGILVESAEPDFKAGNDPIGRHIMQLYYCNDSITGEVFRFFRR